MLKRWCSIKEIEVYLLCEILTSKDTLQGQKNCCEPPYRTSFYAADNKQTGVSIHRLLDLGALRVKNKLRVSEVFKTFLRHFFVMF